MLALRPRPRGAVAQLVAICRYYGVALALLRGGAEDAARDAVGVSAASNLAGMLWGLGGAPGVEEATRIVHAASLTAIADGGLRLRGEQRRGASLPALAAGTQAVSSGRASHASP